MNYRSDIQGLRALAVIAVVLFHADRELLSGGFTGVDVFFVISGYLITRILADELEGGRFSLGGFYRRRVRRLFPALVTMLAASLAAGAVLLPPENYKELARTAIATAFFVSNFEFARLSGYFAAAAEMKPLLHTWSLAVEEQFYIVFPLLLALVWRRRRLLPLVILGGAALSLVLTAVAVRQGYDAWAFYLAPFRAFELMFGAALALRLVPQVRSERVRDAFSWLGLALIVGGLFLIDERSYLPAALAIFPCLGAALIIHAGEGGPSGAGRLLGLRPVTFVGAISYSLYLWHWPFLVFARYAFAGDLSAIQTGAVLLAGFAISILSWRYIEQPFLKDRVRVKHPLRVGMGAAGLVSLLALAVIGARGLPGRFPPQAHALFASADDFSPGRNKCQSWDEPIPYERSCVYGAPGARPSIAVWGDSQGVELGQAIGERAAGAGASVLQLSSSACPPAVGFTGSTRPYCADHNRRILAGLAQDEAIHTVFIVSFYSGYGGRNWPAFSSAFAASVQALTGAGKRVVIIYPLPRLGSDPPAMTGLLAARGDDPGRFGLPLAAHRERNEEALRFLDQLRDTTGAETLRPEAVLCDAALCRAYAPGVGGLYYNANHLSLTGARHLAASIPDAWLRVEPVH